MEILLISVVLVGLGLAANQFMQGGSIKKTPCKGHKWVYRNEGTEAVYMVCGVCKRLPGSDFEEQEPRAY